MKEYYYIVKKGSASISSLFSIFAFIILFDNSISYLSDIVPIKDTIFIYIYLILMSLYLIIQYFIFRLILNWRVDYSGEIIQHSKTRNVAVLFQMIIVLLNLIIATQIIFESSYDTIFLILVSCSSLLFAAISAAILFIQFIRWYITNQSFAVFAYGIAMLSVSIGMILLMTTYCLILLQMPAERNIELQIPFPFYDVNSFLGSLQYFSAVTSAVSYFLIWTCTILLLGHYGQKIGKFMFWIVVSVPIVFFVLQYVVVGPLMAPIIDQLSPDLGFGSVLINILGNMMPGIVGGFLFGMPLWLVAWKAGVQERMKNYLIFTGWALVIFQLSTTASVIHAPFPPFGLIPVVTTGLSCFLILIGLYTAAVSISSDTSLRKKIKSSAKSEAVFLGNIAFSEVEAIVKRKALLLNEMASRDVLNKTGIETSVSNDEVLEYVNDILEEIKMNHERSREGSD